MTTYTARLTAALTAPTPEARLRAALAAGSEPDARLLDVLIQRCRVEPDFYVRDMLTWAITRYPRAIAVAALTAELDSAIAQARSQALHTLSKIGDRRAWQFISRDLLTDPDDEVARSAWRAAVVLVPAGEMSALAAILATQFGRGDGDLQRSLSRAFVELGEVAEPVVAQARRSADPVIGGHAVATEQLIADPESAFAFDVDQARRVAALGE